MQNYSKLQEDLRFEAESYADRQVKAAGLRTSAKKITQQFLDVALMREIKIANLKDQMESKDKRIEGLMAQVQSHERYREVCLAALMEHDLKKENDRLRAKTTELRQQIQIQAEDNRTIVAETERLSNLLNTPETVDFVKGVQTEAAHQRIRWAQSHDAGKSDPDWFWLIGYLAGKALFNPGDSHEKKLHRIITIAAAAANWHRASSGFGDEMRPGIEPPEDRCKHDIHGEDCRDCFP